MKTTVDPASLTPAEAVAQELIQVIKQRIDHLLTPQEQEALCFLARKDYEGLARWAIAQYDEGDPEDEAEVASNEHRDD